MTSETAEESKVSSFFIVPVQSSPMRRRSFILCYHRCCCCCCCCCCWCWCCWCLGLVILSVEYIRLTTIHAVTEKDVANPLKKNGWWSTKGLSSFTYYSIVECARAIILQNSSCPCGLLRGFWSPACFWAIGLGMAFNNGSGSFPSFLVLLSWCLGLVILSVEYIHLTTILRYYV